MLNNIKYVMRLHYVLFSNGSIYTPNIAYVEHSHRHKKPLIHCSYERFSIIALQTFINILFLCIFTL